MHDCTYLYTLKLYYSTISQISWFDESQTIYGLESCDMLFSVVQEKREEYNIRFHEINVFKIES